MGRLSYVNTFGKRRFIVTSIQDMEYMRDTFIEFSKCVDSHIDSFNTRFFQNSDYRGVVTRRSYHDGQNSPFHGTSVGMQEVLSWHILTIADIKQDLLPPFSLDDMSKSGLNFYKGRSTSEYSSRK